MNHELATRALAFAPVLARTLLHASWQCAACALLAAIAFAALSRRSAAARHAVGLGCLVAMMVAAIATFVIAARPLAPPSPVGAGLPPPVRVAPLMLHGSDWLALVVPSIWLAGVIAMLVRQLRGWRAVLALGRAAEAAGPEQARVEVLRRRLGIDRAVALRIAGSVSPFTARMRRPVIWLPAESWQQLTVDQRDALLAHELAHVRRLDWLWNGVQCTVAALLWFHPAVHWLNARVREDREHACDDVAVTACGDPVSLAEALAALERQRGHRPAVALAARGGSLVRRIAHVLAAPPMRVSPRAPLGLALLLCVTGALAANLELPRDALVDLRIDATVAGPLRPGTYREITADSFHAQRYYRGSMDASGRISEVYEEDGLRRPIDPAVRAWLDELAAPRYLTAR